MREDKETTDTLKEMFKLELNRYTLLLAYCDDNRKLKRKSEQRRGSVDGGLQSR